jgi:protein-S-isoprenylcysteine O-methyltransferase Ste14
MNPLIPPPAIAAVIGAMMWAVNRTLTFGTIEFEFREPLALALLAIGLLLMITAAGQFIAARTTINPLRPSRASTLVTTGAFAISRNPIYLADLLMLAAFAVWLANVLNAALLVLFAGYINRYQIIPEERALAQRFGTAYDAYCSRVRRWL